MSVGGKDSATDTGPALNYSQQALNLQNQMYGDTKNAISPYLSAGKAGITELLNGLGLNSATKNTLDKNTLANRIKGYYSVNAGGGNEGKSVYYNPNTNDVSWTPFDGSVLLGTSVTDNSFDQNAFNGIVDKAYTLGSGSTIPTDENTGSLLKKFSLSDYTEDPGYQFRLSEGNKALQRGLASKGQFTSMNPAAAKAMTAYNSDMASQEYGSAYDRYNTDQNNIFNRLAAITGIGQTATNQSASNNSSNASSVSDLLTGMGNTVTAANQAKSANSGSMFNNLLNTGLTAAKMYMAFSDETLKENLVPMGEENGHNVYEFNYIGNPQKYIGVIAQEVQKTNPEAVREIDGYLAVDYAKIGVNFREVA